MTGATAPTAVARSNRSSLVIGGVLVVALLVIALIAGDSSSSGGGAPLSPTSTEPDGTKAMVKLLQSFGADTRVGQATPDVDTRVALLLNDGLDDQRRARLTSWIEGGGTLVVADPTSELAATTLGGAIDEIPRGTCTIDALADLSSVQVTTTPLFDVLPGQRSCAGDGRAAFVVEAHRGRGTIISVGSSEVFVNEHLADAGNSVLAVRLLLPGEGQSVAILDPNPPGSGHTTLTDLIPDRVFQAIIQLGIAFMVYALWRSRRIGRPVTEPQPVAIAGSQFVRAIGGLQQRSRATDRAASALRADVRRALSDRYGVELTTDPYTLAQLVGDRTRLDRDQVVWALGDSPILDESALVQLGHQLDIIRQEALDGRRT